MQWLGGLHEQCALHSHLIVPLAVCAWCRSLEERPPHQLTPTTAKEFVEEEYLEEAACDASQDLASVTRELFDALFEFVVEVISNEEFTTLSLPDEDATMLQ